MYVRMYVCLYVCIYVCMYVCYVSRYLGMYACMYVCMYALYVCMYVMYLGIISFHKVSNKQPKSEKTPVWAIWRPFEEANPPKTRFFGTLPNQRFLTPWAAQS